MRHYLFWITLLIWTGTIKFSFWRFLVEANRLIITIKVVKFYALLNNWSQTKELVILLSWWPSKYLSLTMCKTYCLKQSVTWYKGVFLQSYLLVLNNLKLNLKKSFVNHKISSRSKVIKMIKSRSRINLNQISKYKMSLL